MSFTYGVLGGGRQGTAAAYDMAKFGEAKKVVIADIDGDAALASADWVNTLTHSEIAEGVALDVTDRSALASFLDPVDSFLSAVPYWLNPAITEAAIQARASMCDLGGNTDLVREQLKLDAAAVEAGVAVVPDCGQVPGMGTSLMVHAMSLLDRADHVFMWDGGNVQHPEPPFNYRCTFNIAGLTNEYYGEAVFLRNGKVTMVPTFQREDYEEIEFPAPIGTMEAFVAGGGTSTAPWTFEGNVQTFQNKTLRWKGHFEQWKAVIDMGLMDLDPVTINGVEVVPRDVLHACVEPRIRAADDEMDFVIVRVKAVGEKDGRSAEALVELIDFYDETTGFTAMQRTTGWDGAIVAIMNAKGHTPRGAKPVEIAVPTQLFVDELKKRGFSLTENVSVF
ncbi:MAG: saccharopine dehydrogenase NADP-binding domain-containing protein [Thermoanaerobaculales bacterium]|nr:saccharopine dehydrogenase NADP-binding domain-containing protein [Thermoanaerobaculales bacterium]